MTNYRFSIDLQWFAQGEKSEPATPKKRLDTRKKGQVAKSVEIPAAFILFFVFFSFYVFGDFYGKHLYELITVAFREYMLWEANLPNLGVIYSQTMAQMLLLLAPIFTIAIAVGILSNYFQFGFLFSAETIKFKLNKLNVIEGFRRFFTVRSLVEFFKVLLKLVIVTVVFYIVLVKEIEGILGLAGLSVSSIMAYAADLVMDLGLLFAVVFIILSLFDYAYQKYDYEKNLRMTKQEVKDEHKNIEGDPQIKAKIRERQKRMAMMRMMQELPKADVVITNPTHYAVALQYIADEMEAPKVIAKGVDYVAMKIKELAKQHNIVIMENRTLARALYDRVDIGQMIPVDLFQAVAEVLAYVYKLKDKR